VPDRSEEGAVDVPQLAALRTPTGRELLAAAEACLLEEPADDLRRAAALRRRCPDASPDLAAAATGLAVLRRAAVSKLGADARCLWTTREALEQATRQTVAEHRAARLSGAAPGARLVDLGCGLGADLLAAARAGLRVTGVDSDPLRVELARANLDEHELDGEVMQADATGVDVSAYDLVFTDPARRSGRGRIADPRVCSPSWDVVTGWLEGGVRGGTVVKTTPAIPHALVPDGVEAEWVSDGGDLVEAALWGAPLAEVRRRATLLPSGVTLTDRDDPGAAAVAAPGAYLFEPDATVIRAGLVTAVAARIGGWLVDPHIAYLAADRAVATPFARAFRVVEEVPYHRKALRAALRARDIGPLTIKKRGVDVVPEQLRARLGLHGSTAATLVLTRVDGAGRAYLVEPVSSRSG
jgi:SAM-dependent methyltransferase